jgi:hypothetical protein
MLEGTEFLVLFVTLLVLLGGAWILSLFPVKAVKPSLGAPSSVGW